MEVALGFVASGAAGCSGTSDLATTVLLSVEASMIGGGSSALCWETEATTGFAELGVITCLLTALLFLGATGVAAVVFSDSSDWKTPRTVENLRKSAIAAALTATVINADIPNRLEGNSLVRNSVVGE